MGDSVTKFKPGDRVFVAPKVPCMECSYCKGGHYPQCSEVKVRLPGGFAEYILVPETLVDKGTYLLPEALTYDQSTFIEPLACVVRAQRLAGVREDGTVFVAGCGMSGLLHVKLAKSRKCRVIATDINRNRLAFAKRVGTDITIDAAEDVSRRLADENIAKPDVIILCTSALSAVEQAWKCVDKGGAVVFFAVPGPDKDVTVPINDFWTKEIRILTSYYCGPPDIEEAIDLIESGEIEVEDMITHRLGLEHIAKGFELVLGWDEIHQGDHQAQRSSRLRRDARKASLVLAPTKRNHSMAFQKGTITPEFEKALEIGRPPEYCLAFPPFQRH